MAESGQFNHSTVNVKHGTFQNYEAGIGKGMLPSFSVDRSN